MKRNEKINSSRTGWDGMSDFRLVTPEVSFLGQTRWILLGPIFARKRRVLNSAKYL